MTRAAALFFRLPSWTMPAVVPRSVSPDPCPDLSPDALLVPLAPYEAYAADLGRLGGCAPLGPADDAWLLLAHALARAATLPRAERAPVCVGGARTALASLPTGTPDGVDDRARVATAAEAADALLALAAGLTACGPTTDATTMRAPVAALQAMIAQQEQAGAFFLAFSTLATVRQAFRPLLDARTRGLLLAQQGRVARQLGALAAAAALYRAANRAARTADAPDVAANACLGAGVLASMRGNYPDARIYFRRALRYATRAGSAFHERASHHGLLHAAFAANDIDTALAHGWAALRGLPDDASDERAEALLNLGEVGRQAQEYRAALGACLRALELTSLPRLRLPALGTAARAAAALGERRLLDFLARDIEHQVAHSGQPWENARALVEFAEAFDGIRNDLALQYAARAHTLSVAGAFHEVTARAEAVISARDLTPAGGTGADAAGLRRRSPRARAVLRSLEALSPPHRDEELATC
ncbi:MAG TPA: hypothetical protein VGD56_22755 [Gemmatirosa sp.]